MNIIVGNIQPDEGTIFLNGSKVAIDNVQAATRLGISIVYQERSLADALTVAENIYPVNQPLNRFGFIDYKILYKQTQALLHELGLEELTPATRLDKLSASQKQMVEIAKALVQNPSLLILDEPTSGLDPAQLVGIRALIRELGKTKTIIFSTHIMQEAEQLCDRAIIINKGKLVCDETLPNLMKKHPQHTLEEIFLKLIQPIQK